MTLGRPVALGLLCMLIGLGLISEVQYAPPSPGHSATLMLGVGAEVVGVCLLAFPRLAWVARSLR